MEQAIPDMAAIHVEQHKYDLVSDLRVGIPLPKGKDKSEKLEHGELVLPREAVPRRECKRAPRELTPQAACPHTGQEGLAGEDLHTHHPV